MNIIDFLTAAYLGVRGNLTRAVLTMLMVMIGVGSVITLVAVGNGATKQVTDQVAALGASSIEVQPGWSETAPSQLTFEDADAIRDSSVAPAVDEVAPTVIGQTKALVDRTSANLTVVGTTKPYFAIKNSKLSSGRFLTADDLGHAVAVLDATAEQALTPGRSAVGSTVIAGATPFTVVGVVEEPAGAARLGLTYGGTLYAPIDTVQGRITGFGPLSGIVVSARTPNAVNDAMAQITAVLSARGGASSPPPTFISPDDIRSALGGASESLSDMLAGVAAISLAVAGIGVTNVMLLSVRERTREIGVRKALGARRPWIAGQFLVESTIVSTAGGALGVLLALLITRFDINGVAPLIDLPTVLLAAGISVGMGVVFGTYPAVRAAGLQPVQALRSGT
ncbi:ABC transporter permease [Agromyces sp. NPDC056965]|uniref:ABC transporter permease n=1 Tax=Agromyces sp. NPDC056965 TaxID=3345983 RepID=UPI003631540C